jgi:hypothetical protein
MAELFALRGGHVLPTLPHSPPGVGTRTTVETESAEEDTAQRQESKRLPEIDLVKAEEGRQQPIPKLSHDHAAEGDEQQESHEDQRSQEKPFLSHHLSSSSIRKFVVDRLQAFAKIEHRITLARKQRVDADIGFGGDLFETAPFEFVGDEDFALLFR